MYRLYLDTSSNTIHSGIEKISEGPDSFVYISHDIKTGLCEELPTVLQDLIFRTDFKNLSELQIKEIVCSIGPGSFTGLRTGLSFCKGIAFSKKCPIYGVSSFLSRGYGVFKKHLNINNSLKLILNANPREVFVSNISYKERENEISFDAGQIEVFNSNDVLTETLEIPSDNHLIDDSKITFNPIVILSEFFNKHPVSSTSKNQHFVKMKFGEEDSNILYVKGASAKTLKERGL